MGTPIVVVDYDSEWPGLYEHEKILILGVMGNKVLGIEHIGSTSVPGLGAKPVIDTMVGIQNIADFKECVASLQSVGYKYIQKGEEFIPDRRFFNKGPPEAHRHLHMVEWKGGQWEKQLLFRDYLLYHPEAARKYYELKKELAARFPSDVEAYTGGKTEFIGSALAKARVEMKTPLSLNLSGPRQNTV